MTNDGRCGRCGEARMKSWAELADEEKEVVKRLPDAAKYRLAERRLTHEWCTRCWHEETVESRQA